MTEAAESRARVGELIAGKYRVDREVGAGGMGFVVVATHEELDRRVALKFLLPAIAAREDLVVRFMREARAAVKIQSEHVARVFDVGKHGELAFMVMEYLEGSDLAQALEARGPLGVRESVGFILEACDAVAEAHALGIVHRDIKPANLFLANRTRGKPMVKVLDFGISKSPTSDKDRNITNATAIMGSPSYMSPEQMVASASVDARSDVWALGVTLYELLTRTLPFQADSMPELVAMILQGSFAPVRDRRPDVPAELASVIDRCLQKDREQRFQSVGELSRALLPFAPQYQTLVERIDGIAPPSASTPAPAKVAAHSAPTESLTLAPTVTAPPRSKTPLWLLGAVAAVGVGAVAFAVTRRAAPPMLQTASNSAASFASAQSTPQEPTQPPVVSTAPDTSATATASNAVVHTHAPASSHASAHAATSASAPTCVTVGYFDPDGNKHFKLECH